ncbi:MAG: N-6 DNA methylase, partial [Thiotrichaceae bacterium]
LRPSKFSDVVANYFGIDVDLTLRRELMVRCLLAEYIRGILSKYEHPNQKGLSPVSTTSVSVANAISGLRSVDFASVFEDAAAQLYVSIQSEEAVRVILEKYLATLSKSKVFNLALRRSDSFTFPESLIAESYPALIRDERGKAQTDAELASMLVAFTVRTTTEKILDPGCGDGNLLSAGYDLLREMGCDHITALKNLTGIEADSLAARIAGLRLALKEPQNVSIEDPNFIFVDDMFVNTGKLGSADVILMNPPFKRFEAQDGAPIPDELRQHLQCSIELISDETNTIAGQPNIYNYYVEFIVKSAKIGATLGIILDNKWYQNKSCDSLRDFIRTNCEITAIVTYPYSQYFDGLMISTSMLILKKKAPTASSNTLFIRVEDPSVVTSGLARSVFNGGAVPNGWSVQRVPQGDLNSSSWKTFFSEALVNEYRDSNWPTLSDLFGVSRRGSLAKEGGGIAVYEFPLNRSKYGPKRSLQPNGNAFQTLAGEKLTAEENQQLRELAAQIPEEYLGYAINKSDRISGYDVAENDVKIDPTIESPLQRATDLIPAYRKSTRAVWTDAMKLVVDDIVSSPDTGNFVKSVGALVGLDETVLPQQQLWNALREPYAGELIIPRKLRVGHRVHVNPFAFRLNGRQVRLSSNFLSYSNCLAVEESEGLTREISTRLISAWLLSSFGHLQFEAEAVNREGARSIEKYQLEKIKILDPRNLSVSGRADILLAVAQLPYPVRTDLRPELQPELMRLDTLFAQEIVRLAPKLDQQKMLAEVWSRLFDKHEARNH